MTEFDLKIVGGDVLDGLGGPPRRTDIGVCGDRIAAIGDLSQAPAKRAIQALGLCVAPGFIDIHAHGDTSMLLCPSADSKLRDGVTTELSGNCGSSPFPITDAMREERNRRAEENGVEVDWSDFDGFAGRIERVGTAINRAFLVGQGTVRSAAMGDASGLPTPREFERMKAYVAEAMDAGAFGLSSGLVYPPGCFATQKEIAELAAIAARRGGIYASHIRSEGDRLLEAIDEAATIGRLSAAPVQVSHLKTAGEANWHKIDELLGRLDALRREIDLTADRYPYIASSTDLDALLPEWVHDGGHDAKMQRLKDAATRERIEAELVRALSPDWWDRVMIAGAQSERRAGLEGKTIAQLAVEQGKQPAVCLVDLLIAEDAHVGMIGFAMNEGNLERILRLPFVAVGSDSSARSTEGPTAKASCHPRAFGTFSRVLGRYVRERHLLELPEAVRKMTSLPAGRLGLSQRGRLLGGCFADITILNAETIGDRATYTHPMQFSHGVEYVIVNGAVALDGGRFTGALNGRVLRKH